jgi:putative membrane protein
MAYLYIKAFHIIAVVTWFAGIFYLPRLFVYHAMSANDSAACERFKIMERKLYRGIMHPSAVVALALGSWLAWGYGINGPWLHAKLMLVALLVGYHLYCGRLLAAFREDKNSHSHVWYRWFNEIPVLILVVVVLLVVVKPW